MSDDSRTIEYYSLSLETKERIDRICWAFEEAWRKGGRPQAETFLGETTGAERSALLIELLLLDLDYRRRGGEQPIADEYRMRFPQNENLIETVFQRSEATVALPAPIADEMLGSRIGPYKLLSILGEGGFGIVYLAEQEQPIRRQVAIKILKAGMDTRQVLARFDAERHTLALMDHANIARVFDAGTTDNGRSYFVMELVRGEPITTYCDAHKLTLNQRLGLFLTVCQAVQHAHQKGIIHRDIKPTNILVAVVDEQPVPKIIDFGLAKALAQPLNETSIFTEQGQLLGTPEYMSPEQAGMAIADIDIRSDIYSLGVLLYELLTGTLPFERRMLRQAGFEEICRIIREVEPPRPSARISTLGRDSLALAKNRHVDPSSLHRQLRQELDWIVMKALEKDRTRRYAAAIALAEDIQHYLAHEPVHAGPPGNWYRARKFARRFRTPLGIAAGFIALLVAITILAVRGYYRETKLRADTETARLQAEKAAKNAKNNLKMAREAVKKYYTQVANDPRLEPHNLETLRRDLLKSANEYYEKMISQEGDDRDLQQERVDAFLSRGEIESAIGNRSEAETVYKEALAVLTRLIQVYGAKVEFQNQLACIDGCLGVLYYETGRAKEAEAADKEAIAIWTMLVEKYPQSPGLRDNLANWHHNLGMVYMDAGRAKEAESAYKEAIAHRKIALEKHPEEPQILRDLACSHSNLGHVYRITGRAKEAEAALKEAFTIQKTLVGNHPDVHGYKLLLASIYQELGHLYSATGLGSKAETACGEALAIGKNLAGEHPEVPEYQNRLAYSYYLQGILNREADRTKEAETAYKAALAIQKNLMEKHPEAPEYQSLLSNCLGDMGLLYVDTSRVKEAETACMEALAIQKTLVEKHPEVPEYQNALAYSHGDMGILFRDTGRIKAAETAYKEALAIRRILVEKHPEIFEYRCQLAKIYNSLGVLYMHEGQAKEGEAACQSALAILKPLKESAHDMSECLAALSSTYYSLACFRAIPLAEKNGRAGAGGDQPATAADASREKAFECLHEACDLGYFDIPKSFEQMKRQSELDVLRVRPEYKKLLEKIAARPKSDSQRRDFSDPHDIPFDAIRAEALVNHGSAQSDQGQWTKAAADFKEALQVNPLCAQSFFERGEALAKENQPERALAEYRKVVRLDPRPRYMETYLRHMMDPPDKRALDRFLTDFRELLRVRAEIDPAWLRWVSGWIPMATRGVESLPGVIWVSDMPWVRSTCGYGRPDAERFSDLFGRSIAGLPYSKGIGTHAFSGATPADVVIDISGRNVAAFKAQVGLLDQGSVQFQVLVDGKVKHQTQVMHYGAVEPISLDATGAKQIVLRVLNDGRGVNFCDSVEWGYARFIQAGAGDPLEEPRAKLQSATEANAALFLAEVRWRLDQKELARRWYDRAVAWINKNMREAVKLRQCHAETAKLMGAAPPPPSLARYDRGLGHLDKGETAQALAAFSEAIRMGPATCEYFAARGEAYSSQGNRDQALADFSEAIRLDPACEEALLKRGSIHFDQREREKAEADFKDALRIDPSCAQTFFERGEAWMKANQPERALTEYRKAVWLDPQPQYTEAYVRRVNPADKRTLEQMLADFREPLRIRAEIDPAWLHWVSYWLPVVTRGADNLPGIIWVSDMPWVRSTCGWGRPDAARDPDPFGLARLPYYKGIGTHAFADATPADVVLDISKQKVAVLKAEVGMSHLESGSARFQVLIDGNVKLQTQVLRCGAVEPISLDVTGAKQVVLRVLHGGQKNTYESVEWGYARFIQSGSQDPLEEPPLKLQSPTEANAALFLAEVHLRLDHKELARRWYDKAAVWIDKNKREARKLCRCQTETGKLLGAPPPPPSLAHYHRGLGHLDKGEATQAIAAFSEAIRMGPATSEYFAARGEAYANQGNRDQALAGFNEAIRVDSTCAEALVNRGSIYFGQGQREQAEADFKEALRSNPFCAQAFFDRGEAWLKANQPKRALTEYRKAVWLGPRPLFTEAYLRRVNSADKRTLDQILADFREPLRLRAKIDPAWVHWVSCWLPLVNRGAENRPGIVWVSEMPWVRSTCGWGRPDASRKGWLWQEQLTLGGFPYVKGIWTHAFADASPADVVLDVAGKKFAAFKASATLLDTGSVQFQLLVDGKVKQQVRMMRSRAVEPISLDVTGGKEVVLRVLPGREGNSCDSVVWGFPRLIQAGAEDPIEEPPVKLQSPTDANAALFLAEVHWRLDHKELAHRWFDKAAAWIAKNETAAEKLRQYHSEAGTLLGIVETASLTVKKPK